MEEDPIAGLRVIILETETCRVQDLNLEHMAFLPLLTGRHHYIGFSLRIRLLDKEIRCLRQIFHLFGAQSEFFTPITLGRVILLETVIRIQIRNA